MAKKVSIEVGHGGSDPGAAAGGFKEKDICLSVALKLRDELVRHDVDVLISRTSDTDDLAADFKNKILEYKPTVGISVHFNAGGGEGFEVYQNVGVSSFGLCRCIENQVKAIGQNSRGIKLKPSDNFGIMTSVPVYAYTEGGFIDNPADLAQFDTAGEQRDFGVAYAKGVLEYLGIAWKEPAPPKYYRVQVGAFSTRANAEKFIKELKDKNLTGFIVP